MWSCEGVRREEAGEGGEGRMEEMRKEGRRKEERKEGEEEEERTTPLPLRPGLHC